MYSKVLDHLKQIVIYGEISLSVVSNMSKCIIKSIKFCIGNGLIEFGIPELCKKNLVPSSYLDGKVLLLILSKLSK